MKYLTFLDYPTLEATGASFEAKLKEKDKEIESLKAQMRHVEVTKQSELTETTNAIADLMKTVKELQKEVSDLKGKK
jgi:predicted RNase H-like nuclease (RuvC/YqgF family)